MSATSANKVINNQVGSADAESEETVEGPGDGVGLGDGVAVGDAVKLGDGVAANTTPLTVHDMPPPSPSLGPIASRVRIGPSVLLCS
jgi:hypothetical protein